MYPKISSHFKQFLGWSEKYTRTDMNYLVRGGFWLVSGQVLGFIASFLLVWVFANFLPKEIYGEYRFVLSFVTILGLAALPGMGIGISRAVARGKSSTIYKGLKQKMLWGVLGSIASLGVALYYLIQGDMHLALIFALVSAFIPFIDTFTVYQPYLQGKKDFKRQSIYIAIQRIILVIVMIVTIFIAPKLNVLIIVYLLASTLLHIILLKKTLSVHPATGEVDTESVRYGKHISWASVLRMGSQYIDKILLFHFVGPALLAAYFIAIAVPQELSSVFSHVNNLAFPKLAEKDNTNKKALLRKLFIFMGILGVVVVGYILVAPHLFKLFFPAYLEAIPFSQLFSLMIIFIPAGLFVQYFHARANKKAIYILNTVEPVVLILGYIILIPLLGVYGVILALLLKSLISFLVLGGMFVWPLLRKRHAV